MAAAVAGSLLLASPALAGPGRIAQRKENQQQRIGQGVRSGQLTAGEIEGRYRAFRDLTHFEDVRL